MENVITSSTNVHLDSGSRSLLPNTLSALMSHKCWRGWSWKVLFFGSGWWRRWTVSEAHTLVSWLSLLLFSFCVIWFCCDCFVTVHCVFSFFIFPFSVLFWGVFHGLHPWGFFFLLKLTQFLFVLVIILLCKIKNLNCLSYARGHPYIIHAHTETHTHSCAHTHS